ncbi:Rhamnolipids biosynthesis 3-oxoacyl-[acyl-carrier-protein] reductase [Ceratobasidium theobromae]|uniref:Rhamnolipids biosynthesis 3-oxoacyl-[acyl-carrier-protein] reductase n=1 Tax=Ceratobasidium theobromae TaxID=1582974 RepID=A0A5N5QKK4_9AGAM|nr:Rhamnolipids biosynthesis 3-oxoacyl-[acyl-carrier-protein] reductase [Ceratobasidium theobromae]
MNVTDKNSIKNAVKTVSDADGKLDILLNNAAITDPVASFFSDDSAPEALGNAPFENENFQGAPTHSNISTDWAGLYTTNVASIFFLTAFLRLFSQARGAWTHVSSTSTACPAKSRYPTTSSHTTHPKHKHPPHQNIRHRMGAKKHSSSGQLYCTRRMAK